MIRPVAQYLIKRLVSKANRTPTMVHGNLINSVAVVSNKELSDFQIVEGYVKELRNRGIKTVDFYLGFPNQKIQDLYGATLKDFPFNPKSFGFFGGYKSPELEQSLKKEYDVLIDLSEGSSVECDYLIAKLKAKWKAGRKSKDREFLLDFMIETSDRDTRNFIHNLNKYITGFNTLNAA